MSGWVLCAWNPSSGEVETGGWFPGTLQPGSLVYLVNSRTVRDPVPSQTNKKGNHKKWMTLKVRLTSSLHTHLFAYLHTPVHSFTHTNKKSPW